jgi:hypothetical protein
LYNKFTPAQNITFHTITGMILTFNGTMIHWESIKQKIVALSSTEAELYALVEAAKEAKFIRQWSTFYCPEYNGVKILVDNKSTLEIGDHATHHRRTKHIEVKYLFMRNEIKEGTFKLDHVKGTENLADVLTKVLTGPKFNKIIDNLLNTRKGNKMEMNHLKGKE